MVTDKPPQREIPTSDCITSTKLLQLSLMVSSNKMSDLNYIVRNYRLTDFNNYVQFHLEVERLEQAGRCISPQALGEGLGRPNYSPENDLFIAEIDGKVVGYIDVTPELGIGRAVLDCLVHPELRRKSLATQLFHYAVRCATELKARVAYVNIPQHNVAAASLLSKLGFKFVRRFLELRRGLAEVHLPNAKHIALPCRPLQRGEENKLTEIQNRCFAGTWGYNPNTVEEIAYRLNLTNCSPEDVILVCDEENLVGYCWTTINKEENTTLGRSKGRIYMLGVAPDYQGKGIGKQVLMAGLSHLKSKGLEVAEVTVDSNNRAACALYESVGFKISSTSEWYEKALD